MIKCHKDGDVVEVEIISAGYQVKYTLRECI